MIKAIVAALGGSALIGLILWFGGRSIGADVLQAGWAIPANIVIHFMQLFCAAGAWRLLVGDLSKSRLSFLRWRTIREGINSLLPVAQIGGPVIAVRLMMKDGISGAIAGAGTTLDLTVEVAMQLVFTLAGVGLMTAIGVNPAWASWIEGGLALGAVLMLGFILAQRAGMMRLIERMAVKLQGLFPQLSLHGLQGLHLELMRLQGDRTILAKAALLQFLSWSGGCAEIYVALRAMGHEVPLQQAFVIESLGMAARSLGFAVPGALGIQEGGFLLVCGVFGVGPEVALALSMVKRLREILIGCAGLLMWQWSELARWLKGRKPS